MHGHEHDGKKREQAEQNSSSAEPEAHDEHHPGTYWRRFCLALVLTIPTWIWSDFLPDWIVFRAPIFPGSAWLPALFGTAVYLSGGWFFIPGMIRELSSVRPGRMTLVALAITCAFLYNVAIAFYLRGAPPWAESSALVTVVLFGQWIELKALSEFMPLLIRAQRSRSHPQVLADRGSFFLTSATLATTLVTFFVWMKLDASTAFGVERVVSVLVIASPHALGLAIPLVSAIAMTLAAQHGVHIRDRRGLEDAGEITTVVFEKTGTLTRGEFRVVEITPVSSLEKLEVLRLAAAVQRDSEHPIAQGIVNSAAELSLPVPAPENFAALADYGATARVGKRELSVGGPALLQTLESIAPTALLEAADRAAQRGQATIWVLEGQQPLGVLAVADAIRDESRQAIRRLHDLGVEVVLLTSDSEGAAAWVADELRIDQVFAEVLPNERADKIQALMREGKRVAIVGDSVHDAPALLMAHVGFAMGNGTDAGEVVLFRADPRNVARTIELSQSAYRKMVQNLWWTVGYNVVAIPLAAGVLAPLGIIIHPLLGALLMTASTLILVMSTQRLRRRHI